MARPLLLYQVSISVACFEPVKSGRMILSSKFVFVRAVKKKRGGRAGLCAHHRVRTYGSFFFSVPTDSSQPLKSIVSSRGKWERKTHPEAQPWGSET